MATESSRCAREPGITRRPARRRAQAQETNPPSIISNPLRSGEQGREEARATENSSAEILGDGLSHVGESVADAERRARNIPGSEGEDGNVFARMVRGGPARIRIATVVGGEQQEIGGAELGEKRSEKRVEFFERARKAFDVLAMAEEHVEIHEVGKDQTGGAFTERGAKFVHAVGVAFRGDVLFDSAAVIDVVNLSNAEHRNILFQEDVEEHRLRRFDGIVMAALGALEISGRAEKGPRNDAPDAVLPIEQLARDFAYAVKLGDGDDFLVRRDLEHAVP